MEMGEMETRGETESGGGMGSEIEMGRTGRQRWVIDREREEIDIGGKAVIWDGRDSDMEMGRETARVVFGGRSINVYNKVQCKHIVHFTELYVMLLNDPLCTYRR